MHPAHWPQPLGLGVSIPNVSSADFSTAASSLGLTPDQLGQLQTLVPNVDVTKLSQNGLQELQALSTSGLNDITDQAKAQLLADTGIDVDSLSSAVKGQLGDWSKNTQAVQGAGAAADLITNGYNPDNPADNQKMVTAIAGGLSLIPGVGPVLAGAVMALWYVGQAIACPVTNAFADLFGTPHDPSCGGKPCTTSGNWTPAMVISDSKLPPHPPGSFADLLIGALANFSAQYFNCKANLTAYVKGQNVNCQDLVVDGMVTLWNQTHEGPSVPYFIPPLSAAPLIPYWTSTSGTDPKGKSGDANVNYAFQPASNTYWYGQKDAFGNPWFPPAAWGSGSSGPLAFGGGSPMPTTAARYVNVNTGAYIQRLSFSASTAAASAITPQKVVATAAVVTGGAVVGVAAYAYATGKTIGAVFAGLLKGII